VKNVNDKRDSSRNYPEGEDDYTEKLKRLTEKIHNIKQKEQNRVGPDRGEFDLTLGG